MKCGLLAQTENVKRANKAIQVLANRPKEEMVGLGLIFGPPGLGKTRYAKAMALTHEDWVYERLEGSDTAKSFLQRLYAACMTEISGNNEYVSGSTNKIFSELVRLLQDHPLTILVDEIDYAFGNRRILRCIRDIVDETYAEVIMIGMQHAQQKLLKLDAHYFDRCSCDVEFTPLTQADVALVVKHVSDIEIDEPLANWLHKTGSGTLRRVVKELASIEAVAEAKGVKRVTYEMRRTGRIA